MPAFLRVRRTRKLASRARTRARTLGRPFVPELRTRVSRDAIVPRRESGRAGADVRGVSRPRAEHVQKARAPQKVREFSADP